MTLSVSLIEEEEEEGEYKENSLSRYVSLSLTHTHTRAHTCEDDPCVRNVRVSNPRTTMLQLIHDSSGYRLPSKADAFNPEFNPSLSIYLSVHIYLSLSLRCVPRTSKPRKFTAPLLSTIVKDAFENGRSPI